MIASAQPLHPPLLLPPADAARLLSISERTLARMAARGEIVPIRMGPAHRIVRYSRTTLENYIAQREVAAESGTRG